MSLLLPQAGHVAHNHLDWEILSRFSELPPRHEMVRQCREYLAKETAAIETVAYCIGKNGHVLMVRVDPVWHEVMWDFGNPYTNE